MKLIKHNWQWKLASLLIGIFMWSYITAGINPTQSMTLSGIPIQIQNQDALASRDLQVMEMDLQTVSVRVTGKRNDLGAIKHTDISASIDAKSLKEGVQVASILYKAPQHVVINETSDATVSMTVEKVITQSKQVTAKQTGELEAQFILNSLSVTPESVEVTGPRSLVEKVDHVQASIDLTGLESDTSANKALIALDVKNNVVEGVRLSLESANVACSIYKQKELPIKLDMVGESPDQFRVKTVNLAPNTILVKGKQEVIDQLTEIPTKPLDRAPIVANGTVPIQLEFPDGITPVSNQVEIKGEVTVEKLETKKLSKSSSKILLENVPPGRKASLVDPPADIQLEVQGFPSDLEKIGPDQVQVFLDLTSLSEGRNYGILQAKDPSQGKVLRIDPQQLLLDLGKE